MMCWSVFGCCSFDLATQLLCFLCFFCFKQKTAYEMRISDWSSDVCSSDLGFAVDFARYRHEAALGLDDIVIARSIADRRVATIARYRTIDDRRIDPGNRGIIQTKSVEPAQLVVFYKNVGAGSQFAHDFQIGRASCRERVCHYGEISGVAV